VESIKERDTPAKNVKKGKKSILTPELRRRGPLEREEEGEKSKIQN